MYIDLDHKQLNSHQIYIELKISGRPKAKVDIYEGFATIKVIP